MYLKIRNSGEGEAYLSKQGQVGAGLGKLGQVGVSLNLQNTAIVFCRLFVLFTIYVRGTNCVNHTAVRNEQEGLARKVDWLKIDGSSPKPKRLHLEKDETDSLYHCPIQAFDHDGFKSQRRCRKHVNTKHSWFFFFDEKPDVSITKKLADDVSSSEITKQTSRVLPSFSVSSQIGVLFTKC